MMRRGVVGVDAERRVAGERVTPVRRPHGGPVRAGGRHGQDGQTDNAAQETCGMAGRLASHRRTADFVTIGACSHVARKDGARPARPWQSAAASMEQTRRPWMETLTYLAGLVALSVAFRLPALVNAATVDSDAAIVGLQARHILRGEWSWFLWGSGYQTSVDSLVAAAFFAVLGATSLALVLSTLTGHVVATCLAFATLKRHMPRPAAAVAVLPLVFTSSPLHTYILNPPRQAALTLAFAAVFVIDGASLRSRGRARLAAHAAGTALASLACFADPYALLLLPPLVLVGVLAAFDRTAQPQSTRPVLLCVAATLVGALLGLVPFVALLGSPGSVHGETTFALTVFGHNLKLLLAPCLPWLLGTTAYVPHALLGYVPWEPGPVFHALQRCGGLAFLALILTGGVALVRGCAAWPVRRLGGFGLVVAALTVAAFLASVMVMDLFSARYLVAIVLFSPFAVAPVALRVGWGRLFVLLAPFLAASGVCGWVGYGDEVRGAAIVSLPGGGARDEIDLGKQLEARGIHAAIADYWVSYRLTFLYGETVVVVPIHAREDRYAPYRRAYDQATRTAYVFDPGRSREDLATMQKEAFEGTEPWGKPVERLHVGGLTAVVFEKGGVGSGNGIERSM